MQQHRLLLCFQKLKCPDEQRNIVTVNRSVITQAELLENDARDEQTFDTLFDFMRELCYRFARDTLHQVPRLVMEMRERRTGGNRVQLSRDCAEIFGD